MALKSSAMVADSQAGIGKGGFANRSPEAIGNDLVRRYQGWAADEGIFDEMFECLRRNMRAKTSKRVESDTEERGYAYETVDDGMTQVAAARVLAQILRLLPGSGAVNVNLQDNSVRVTVDQQLSEVLSIGGDTSAILAEMRSVIDRASGITEAPKNQVLEL